MNSWIHEIMNQLTFGWPIVRSSSTTELFANWQWCLCATDKLCQTWKSYGTHIYESCHTQISHGTHVWWVVSHMNESRHTYALARVMSHINQLRYTRMMSHITHEWVTAHLCKAHNLNQWRYTYTIYRPGSLAICVMHTWKRHSHSGSMDEYLDQSCHTGTWIHG